MQKPYASISRLIQFGLPLVILIVIPPPFFSGKQNRSEQGNNKKETLKGSDPFPREWIGQVTKEIAEQEYNIVWSSQEKAYKTPNRAQNFRVSFKPGMIAVQPRISVESKHDDWSMDLKLQRIQFDNDESFFPDNKALPVLEKNKICYNHNNNFTVEYINSKDGLRQNFIINKIPNGRAGIINVKMKVGGGLQRPGKQTIRKCTSHWGKSFLIR